MAVSVALRPALLGGLVTAIVTLVPGGALAQKAPRDSQPLAITRSSPMQVQLARLAIPGCEPNCPEWIAMQGDIDEQTLPQLRRLLATIGDRKLPIVIDSPGGVVGDSFTIARMIRARGHDVVVGKTLFKPCPETDAQCRKPTPGRGQPAIPIVAPAKCASSCAFILAGGKRRYVGARSFVGVHQIRTVRTEVVRKYRVWTRVDRGVPVVTKRELVSEKQLGERVVATKLTDSVYGRIDKFFVEMGIGPRVSALLKATPPSTIHWISREDLDGSRMATDDLDAPTLLGATPTFATAHLHRAKPLPLRTPRPEGPAEAATVAGPAVAAAPVPAPVTPGPAPAPVAPTAALAPEPARPAPPPDVQRQVLLTALQQRLIDARCGAGEADGIWGARSKSALAEFAGRAGLKLPDGEPDQSTLDAVRARPDVTCVPAVEPAAAVARPKGRPAAAKRKVQSAGGPASDPFADPGGR